MKQRRKTCSVDGCNKFAHARGLCPTHYTRHLAGKRLDAEVKSRGAITAERFWLMVDKVSDPNGCWLWTGRTHEGYGRSGVPRHKGQVGAHRAAWYWTHGSLPPQGMHLDHLCMNRRCVNLDHLEVVTPRENTMRSANALFKHWVTRTECDKGHPLSGDNLAIRKGGGRKCRACHAEYMRAYRVKSIQRGPVKARRPAVTPDERAARRLVKARSGGTCEGRCLNTPATDWHHRMPRSVGGLWEAVNGMHLCRECHSWVTDHPVDGADLGWHLWSTNDPATVPVLRRGEWVLLDADGGWESVNPEAIGGDAA